MGSQNIVSKAVSSEVAYRVFFQKKTSTSERETEEEEAKHNEKGLRHYSAKKITPTSESIRSHIEYYRYPKTGGYSDLKGRLLQNKNKPQTKGTLSVARKGKLFDADTDENRY